MFPKLVTLRISDNTVVNDAIAQSLKGHCSNLRTVILKGCNVSAEVLKLCSVRLKGEFCNSLCPCKYMLHLVSMRGFFEFL